MEPQGLAIPMTGLPASESAEAAELAGLLDRAQAGDLAAFEQLIVLHERAVFLTAWRLLGHAEDAQDAAQEVFLRLHKHLGRFGEVRSFRPWLHRMTVNACRDVYRRRRGVTTVPLDQSPQIAVAPNQLSDLTAEEQRRLIAEGLRTLPERERAALVLRDIEGLPTREVARILGSAEVTVRVQVAKARLKIKKFIEQFRKGQS